MNIDYVMAAHGVGGGTKRKPLPEVTGFVASQDNTGTIITLKWTNPIIVEFVKVHIYSSNSDISNVSFKEISKVAKLEYSGTNSTVNCTTSPNLMNYYKIFVEYSIIGEMKTSNGSNVNILSKDKKPPSTVTSFKVVKEDNQSVELSWVNPTDSDFSKTTIRYKVGSYPTSITDGTLAYEGVGKYVNVTGLTNDVVHYFRAFTQDTSGNINSTTTGQQVSGTPSKVPIYGVRIDTTNSNPESALVYTDSAVGMVGGSTSWDSVYPFNQIKPYLVKDGKEVVELNKNDFTKNVSGGSVDITSGASGDVMIKFPKIWWKLWKEGNYQYVKYASYQVDSTWKALGHINTRTGLESEFVYIGAYLGYSDGSKLRSLSGKTPTVSTPLATFRTQSQANGSNYNQIAFYQITMLQILYTIRYKNLDSQTALGRGYTVYSNSDKTSTGGTNSKGMYYGETTGKQQMSFCGIEDFYGNCYQYVDGIKTDSSNNILISTKNLDDNMTGATSYPSGINNTSGYMKEIQGTTETAFNLKVASGSATTHYSDNAYLNGGYFAAFGGGRSIGANAGAFGLRVSFDAGGSSSIAARFALFA